MELLKRSSHVCMYVFQNLIIYMHVFIYRLYVRINSVCVCITNILSYNYSIHILLYSITFPNNACYVLIFKLMHFCTYISASSSLVESSSYSLTSYNVSFIGKI